jgi:hypothetical protein
MNNFFSEHGTKIYGAITSFLGALATLITTGAFDGLMTDAGVRWLGIVVSLFTALLGGMTVARGFTNTTAVRVAEAMETAIKAQPPSETP